MEEQLRGKLSQLGLENEKLQNQISQLNKQQEKLIKEHGEEQWEGIYILFLKIFKFKK